VKIIIILLFSLLTAISSFAQEITKPNFALATHPMIIEKMSVSDSSVNMTITLENKISNGSFCVNDVLFIQEIPDNKKAYVRKTAGIPVCPDTYKFKKPGEKLTFELDFFGFHDIPKYLNVIEDCNDNCFTIYGVIIDEQMNHDIDMGFGFYKSGNPELSVASFEKAVNEHPDYPFGYLYENIIDLYAELKNYEKAAEWFLKLSGSDFADKDQLLEQIQKKDYFSRLTD